MEEILSKRTLSVSDTTRWIEAVGIGPLGPKQLAEFFEALARTPQAWVGKNQAEVDLTFQDLSVESDSFYLPFSDFEESQTLSDVFEKTLKSRLDLPGLGAAARIFAPLAISPDFRIVDFATALGDEGALLLVRQLRADGDPFSILAAFQIACARLERSEFRGEAKAIFDLLIATDEYCEEIAHDFAACALLIVGYADTQGAFSGLPLPLRRGALLLKSGWAVRVLNAKDVQRPQFFKAAEQWVGSSYRLAGLVDRREGRWWFREWLLPEIVAGQIRGRIKGVALSVAKELRPEEWEEHLRPSEGKVDLLQIASGPLDEFSANWQTNSFPSTDFCSVFETADTGLAKSVLFNTLLAFEMPDDLPQSRQKVLSLLDGAGGEEFAALANLALMAGARWRDCELANEALNRSMLHGIGKGWSLRLLGEWCVAAAFAGGEPSDMLGKLEKNLSELLNRDLQPAQASELVGLLDKLIDLIPDARGLRRLRSAALLAT